MKKLIISMKTTNDMFDDFKKIAKTIKKGKSPKSPHYEIAFESKKDFNKFMRNISVLISIIKNKPKSIYQLAKATDTDLANMKKIINFFAEIGAVRIKENKKSGRTVKTPIVDYQKIEFDLQAA